MKIYGSMLCKDCVACCAALDAAGYQKYLDEKQAQYTAWKEANGK